MMMILCRLGLHDWTRWTKPVDHIQKRMCERCHIVQEVMSLLRVGYKEGFRAGMMFPEEKRGLYYDNPT